MSKHQVGTAFASLLLIAVFGLAGAARAVQNEPAFQSDQCGEY
jgi:hypothetical protein